MENTLRSLAPKLTLAASAFGVSLLLAPGALAAEANNSNTGAGSDNDASVTIDNDVTINSNNTANIINTINISANTGNNSADKNTGDGSVNTGDINGSVNIGNDVNGNTLNSVGVNCGGLCDYNLDISTSNNNTGANSSNNADANVSNNVDITQNNNLDIDNNVGADLNTGGNSADKNTGDGSVKTGDINFDITVSNSGNNNSIGSPVDQDDPDDPITPGRKEDAILPEEGDVLAAAEGLPITGGGLPIIPVFSFALAGLALKKIEEKLRLRFLPETK